MRGGRGLWRRVGFVGLLVLAVAAGTAALVYRAAGGASLRASAEARLSALLGQPVAIGGMRVHFLPRLSIAGTAIVVGNPATEAPSIAIERITLLPDVRSLWRGTPVIEEVRLEGLIVSVLRDLRGGWHVPAAVPAPTAGDRQGLIVRRVTVTGGRVRVFDARAGGGMAQTVSVSGVEADVNATAAGLRLAPIRARIGSAVIEGEGVTGAGAVQFDFRIAGITDGDLPALLGLVGTTRPAGLRLRAPASAAVVLTIDRRTLALSARGALRAEDVAVEPLRLQHVEAPFTLESSTLRSRPAVFRLNGGAHTGTVTVDLAGPAPRWALDSRLTGVDLGGFLDALAGSDARIDGTASVAGVVHGRLDDTLARTVAGEVHVTIVNGFVRQFPLLAAINRAARLTEGDSQDTRFERLTATVALGGGRATTQDLVMEAGQVRVEAAGAIGFDRSLALRGVAVLAPERAAAATRSVRELSGLQNEKGELEIPLTIGGTLDAPAFRLDARAVIGQGLRGLLERLRGHSPLR